MNNYKKGINVEEPFVKSQIPLQNLPEDFLWMHVNPGTKMRNVLEHALDEVKNKARRVVVWSGSGPAVGKVISCAEIMKRQHPEPFHQVSRICYRKMEERWDPVLEGLDPLVVVRELPTVHILLSKDSVDTSQPGYQAPARKSTNDGRKKCFERQQKKPLRKKIDCKTFESLELRSARTKTSKMNQRGRGGYNQSQPDQRDINNEKSNFSGNNQRRFPKPKKEQLKDNFEAGPFCVEQAGALTMVRQGSKVLVLCGPSGSGKSSLLRLLFEEFPDKFGFSVSHTTRNPRPGEENGKHYHFTNKEEMEQAIGRGEFLESAVFSNNMYGTSVAAVRSVCESGKVCVLDIDVEGVKQVKKTDLNPLLVFIKPPSLADLETRLRGRNTETEDSLQRRLDAARQEMVYGETQGNFDIVLVNDNLDKTYKKLKEFVLTELEKTADKNGMQILHSEASLVITDLPLSS